MKTVVVTILIFSTFSLCAQDNKVIVKSTPKAMKIEQLNPESPESIQQNQSTSNEVSYPITVSYTSKEQKNQTTTPRTLEIIDADIFNIKTKMEHVKNSPEMDAKAIAEGWYDRNEILLKNLEQEKSNLLKN